MTMNTSENINTNISLSQSMLPLNDSIRESIQKAAKTVRETTPMAQSFTNFVTMNFVANAQLAAGGAAAMSFLPDEVEALSEMGGASYVNVGTLLPFYTKVLAQISTYFAQHNKPWVLDPVAAGLGEDRTAILRGFKDVPPSIIRGNASEIIAMANIWDLAVPENDEQIHGPQGVESTDEVDSAIESAKALAQHMAAHTESGIAAVAVSGAVDLITDGERVFRLPGGSPLMTKITGAGCSLGGVTAVYLAVSDPLSAALGASLLYNIASERAQEHACGPASFQTAFLDNLWKITPEEIAAGTIISE